ncbi:MAG TPA: HlyD family efflux transporter periplasmic adaptor subunit [Bryobacteraceae bacterium]|nr:HlyD family efflux transporter periplasmic adaptor subunit [Bryobacteraceae bacterium]
MSTAFSRTLRSLNADGFGRPAAGIVTAALLAGAWGAWCGLVKISLYEVTSTARVEVDRAVAPVQSPLTGRVVAARLVIAREVRAGDILVELDAEPEQRQIGELRARLASLGPHLAALRDQADAEQQARLEEQTAGRSAALEALASVRQADAPARFSEDDAKRLQQLRANGLIAEREYARGQSEALKLRAAVDMQQAAVRRLEDEQRMRQSDRAARLKSLTAEITRIEAEMPTIQASIARLEYEIERRLIRAPMSGKLAEAAALRAGAVVREGEKLGAIVPDGKLAVIAQFPPPAALGRVRSGQAARLRLQGFPWMQYGSVHATVTRVAGEVRDNSVRVELAVAGPAPGAIPLQHGLPGSVEVEVERVTPAELLLRSAGRMLASPRETFQ